MREEEERAGFASRSSSFFRTFWIVGKIASGATVGLVVDRETTNLTAH
jgi:hypothetical protein